MVGLLMLPIRACLVTTNEMLKTLLNSVKAMQYHVSEIILMFHLILFVVKQRTMKTR